jgi:predicted HicB family RNase H-like nuclease
MSIPDSKVRVTIIIEKELKEKLKEFAKKDKRSLSSYIDTVLTKHIKTEKA